MALSHVDQLHVEHERRRARDRARLAGEPVAERRRHDELPPAADAHADDPLVPAADHDAVAEDEAGRLAALAAVVEHGTIGKAADCCTTTPRPAVAVVPVPRFRSRT